MSLQHAPASPEQPLLARAIDSDRAYFEMGAELQPLDGATMAWMPGLSASPGTTVIYRVDANVVADDWIAAAEKAMAAEGASLCRIYLDQRHERADAILRGAGYVARDELVFVDSVPPAAIHVTLLRVESDADWAHKRWFHQNADRTPDGHDNSAADWVELERRKCDAGMEAYLAELDGEVVGAVGAIWCDGFVRAKNLVVAPHRRRRGVGRAMLGAMGTLGRARGLPQQCVVAVKGEEGELLYRAMGMTMIGFQVEWSKPIGATP